jgi:histone H1/5
MGKNSLIKSTSKKTAEKETEEKKKKTASATKKTAKSAAAKTKKTAKKSPAKTKSAAKSKTAARSKTTTKKATAKKTPKAKTTAKKTAKPKAAAAKTPKAKAAPKKATKAKAAAKKPAAPKKKAAPKKPKSAKEILFQQFESWTPASLYTPPDEKSGLDFTAPPMIDTDSPDETQRMKKLLFLSYSPEALKSAAETSAAAQKARKAEAQKEAAEKAEAEKEAAAQPPAAEEKVAPEADVSVSYPPPEKAAPADPMEKAFKYGIAGFAALLLILIGYSFANMGNYYLDSANGGLKIYQGRFAPIGKELIMTLPGVKLAEPAEEVYTRSQVFPLIANFYMEKADALLATPGLPDYEGIRRYLKEALKYATSGDQQKAIYTRLDGIELLTLLYKADVAASKDNIESLEESLDYLNDAARLEIDSSQAALIDQKREAVRARIEQLQAQEKAAEAEAATAKE